MGSVRNFHGDIRDGTRDDRDAHGAYGAHDACCGDIHGDRDGRGVRKDPFFILMIVSIPELFKIKL